MKLPLMAMIVTTTSLTSAFFIPGNALRPLPSLVEPGSTLADSQVANAINAAPGPVLPEGRLEPRSQLATHNVLDMPTEAEVKEMDSPADNFIVVPEGMAVAEGMPPVVFRGGRAAKEKRRCSIAGTTEDGHPICP